MSRSRFAVPWLALTAGVFACTDAPTAPPGIDLDTSLLAVAANQATLVVRHTDQAEQGYRGTLRNETWQFFETFGFPRPVRVPKFDPLLGELVSVRLSINAWLHTRWLQHAFDPFFASNDAYAKYSLNLQPVGGLENIVGALAPTHSYDRFDWWDYQRCGGILVCTHPKLELNSHRNWTFEHDETYVIGRDSEAEVFIQSDPLYQVAFQSNGSRWLKGWASHSGQSIGGLITLGAYVVPSGKTLAAAATAAAKFLIAVSEHDLFGYSDVHTTADASVTLAVEYTYTPFPDSDNDGLTDNLDPDDDNDGVADEDDAFPLDPSEWSDNDGDGLGDNADADDDNDGQTDDDEATCGSDPLNAGSTSPDYDADNSPDCVDGDDDNDGVPDEDDAFPLDPSEWSDNDGDGLGDNADADDDNDGQTDDDEATCGSDPLNAGSTSPDYDADNSPDCVDGDDDNDGVPDDLDAFPKSDMEPNVIIDGDDTGVGNQVLADGATFNDRIVECAAASRNHGHFVSCVSKLTDEWSRAGLISRRDKGRIMSSAGGSRIPV